MTAKWIFAAGLMAMTGCVSSGAGLSHLVDRDGAIVTRGEGPDDARPEACYAQDVTPATIETVTEQVMIQPPQIGADGTVRAPAIFRTETRQAIVQERREIWFETPCEAETNPDFIAALQRALGARGVYSGPITGQMDMRTRRAVRVFQEPQGLNSGVLSLAAARILGLAVWDPDAAGIRDDAI